MSTPQRVARWLHMSSAFLFVFAVQALAGHAAPSRSLRDVVSTLRSIKVDDNTAYLVPAAAVRNLTLLKRGVRAILVETLATAGTAEEDPAALTAKAIATLEAQDIPVGDAGGYGVISEVTIERSAVYADWMIATTTLNIPYGSDRSVYVFERNGQAWKLVLAQETNGYANIGEAQGNLSWKVALTAEQKPYLITASVTPAMASVWQGLRLKVLRPGLNADRPAMLASRTFGYNLNDSYYFSVMASGFGLMFLGDTQEPDLAGYTGVHFVEYAVSEHRATFLQDTVLDPSVWMAKWITEKAPHTSRALDSWHDRLHAEHWECGPDVVALSQRSAGGREEMLAHMQCDKKFDSPVHVYATFAASHRGFRLKEISPERPKALDFEGSRTTIYAPGKEGVTAPIPIANAAPRWPKDLPMSSRPVKLRMSLEIDSEGKVTSVALLNWPGSLRVAVPAMHAVRAWRYTPAMKDGKAVNAGIESDVVFARQ